MEGSADDFGAPDSWEVADLDESMNRLNLILSSSSKIKDSTLSDDSLTSSSAPSASASSSSSTGDKLSDDVINQVDQFLREAIQNPRERLSVLRMEQDVEKFIGDPNQQQLEFEQLPTSYLRLAAHRVAQHYSLQSMVLLDNSLPDSSGSRIIVRKNSECKLPVIRLADIPVKLSSENNSVMKVAIKQRPQKQSQVLSNANSNSGKNCNSKSVEERKEEYSRARARIFSLSNNGATVGGKPERESRQQDNSLRGSLGVPRVEDKPVSVSDVSSNRGLVESSTNTSRGLVESSTNTSRGLVESSTNTTSRGLLESSTNTSRGLVESSTNTSRARSRTEKEPVGSRYRQSNRVAIFRDRDVERQDPDYDRSYERYMQRFDPGFGFSDGSYTMQPMYTAVVNFNTEFPHLGSAHGPQLSTEHRPRPLPQHIPGTWVPQQIPSGIRYGHPETMMSPFNPSQVGAHSSSAMYLHSLHYPCQRPGMPFLHHEHVYQPFTQSHQPPPGATFGLARPQ
ncbi:putative R3H domain, SUZ domain-containing protein [Lupinus albus]|uniref:Putative R3H domain, SUZ domain-containing protein n=1 Tax=Lupinus albus TaxID=3870 RepID=A0A6A4R000_LUPAL|nr:putative R3H domain, SUZ domain-containing protein [Lupinus albus]